MSRPSPVPDFETFRMLAAPGRVVPVRLEFPFDTETAVTAYAKLRQGDFSFLLESVIGGERWARYSFLGSAPREVWKLEGERISRWSPGSGWSGPELTTDPFGDFERWISRFEPVELPGLPRFWGGAVGFFGYDTVRWLERLPGAPRRDVECPDACFMLADQLLAVDKLFDRALAIRSVPIPEGSVDLRALYDDAVHRLREWMDHLRAPSELAALEIASFERPPELEYETNRSAEDFQDAVERIREYIRAGDVFQAVLSQRIESAMTAGALTTYRALRTLNPSPYLYLLELDGVRLIGSSPELLVRVEGGEVTVRPIAGTRRRGGSPAEDEALAEELRGDEKERAEHLMLVDLGRNDVARVAEAGSVRVPEFMEIERYSDVIHLVSEVTGRLRADLTAVDAFRACFPAGTLSGAPKVRAMEIIDELEPTRRGPYGGAAGFVGFGARTLDMAIAIRTILDVTGRAYVQAGAGIVHDSDPSREWEETLSKARALLRALSAVRSGARGPGDGAAAR